MRILLPFRHTNLWTKRHWYIKRKIKLTFSATTAFYGGKMIERVSHECITFADLPYRLEAGTPNIAGVIGFGAVLDWLKMGFSGSRSLCRCSC